MNSLVLTVRQTGFYISLLFSMMLFASISEKENSAQHFWQAQSLWIYQSAFSPEIGSSGTKNKNWYRQWHETPMDSNSIPESLTGLKNISVDLSGWSHMPEQLLRLFWIFAKTPKDRIQSYSASYCFRDNSSEEHPFELRELEQQDKILISCKKSTSKDFENFQHHEQRQICRLTTAVHWVDVQLALTNGAFDPQCTQKIKPTLPDDINDSEQMLLVYHPPGSEPATEDELIMRANSPGSDPQTEKPSVLYNGLFGNGNNDSDDKPRQPPVIALDSELVLTISGFILDLQSLDDDQPVMGGWKTSADIDGIQLHFMVNNQLQIFSISVADWLVIQNFGMDRSPSAIYAFVQAKKKGRKKAEDIIRELMLWTNGFRLPESGSFSSGIAANIASLMEELRSIPPAQITIEGWLQEQFEAFIQDRTDWQASDTERNSLSQWDYLVMLSEVKEALKLATYQAEKITLLSRGAIDTSPFEQWEGQTLELLKAETLVRNDELAEQLNALVVERIKRHLVRALQKKLKSLQENTEEASDGIRTVPSKKKVLGNKENTQTGDPAAANPLSGGTEQNKQTAIVVEKKESDEFEPPLPPLNPDDVIEDGLILSNIINEMLYERCGNWIVRAAPTNGLKIGVMMAALDIEILQSLITMLQKETGLHPEVAMMWETYTSNVQTRVWLRKGVIVPLLWAQGVPASHPFIAQIANGAAIYRALDAQGPKAVAALLQPEPDPLYSDATLLLQLARNNPEIQSILGLERVTDKLHVDYILELVANKETPLNWSVPQIELLRSAGFSDVFLDFLLPDQLSGNSDPKSIPDDYIPPSVQQVTAVLAQAGWNDVEVLKEFDDSGAQGTVFEVQISGQIYALKHIRVVNELLIPSLTKSMAVTQQLIDSPIEGFNALVERQYISLNQYDYLQLMRWAPETLTKRLNHEAMEAEYFYPQYFQKIVEQVTLLHNAGIFHRDLKPDNISVLKNGEIILLDQSNLMKRQDFDVAQYDSLAVKPRGKDDFKTIVGTSAFAGQGFQELALDETETTVVNALDHDLAALANIWFFGRMGQPLMVTYRNNLETLNPEAASFYGPHTQLGQYGASRLMQEMYSQMQDDPSLLSKLFQHREVKMVPQDQWVSEYLLLYPDQQTNALKELDQVMVMGNPGYSLEAPPDAREDKTVEEVDTHQIPGQISMKVVIASVQQDDVITMVRTWRDNESLTFYQSDEKYILGERLGQYYREITLEDFLRSTVHLWEGKERKQHRDIGFRTDLPLRQINLSGESEINPDASSIVVRAKLHYWVTEFIDLINDMADAHQSNLSWLNFEPYITELRQIRGNDMIPGYLITSSQVETPLPDEAVDKQRAMADNFNHVAQMLLDLLNTLSVSNIDKAMLSLNFKSLRDSLLELLEISSNVQQLDTRIEQLFLYGFSKAGVLLMKRKYSNDLAWALKLQLFINGVLQQLASMPVELEEKQIIRLGKTIDFYEQELAAINTKVQKPLKTAISQDSKVQALLRKPYILKSWLNQYPPFIQLEDLLFQSGYSREIQALLTENWIAPGVRPFQGLQNLNSKFPNRVSMGNIILALRAFGRENDVLTLAKRDPNPNYKETGIYLAAHALTLSESQLRDQLHSTIGFRAYLDWARSADRLYRRGFRAKDLPAGAMASMLGSSKVKVKTTWQDDDHPFMVLMNIKGQLEGMKMTYDAREHLQKNLGLMLTALDSVVVDTEQRRETETELPACYNCMQKMMKRYAIELYDEYFSADSKRFGVFCDSCGKVIAEHHYNDGYFRRPRDLSVAHCKSCELDLCWECVAQQGMPCSESGCSGSVKIISARDICTPDSGYRTGAHCDQCDYNIICIPQGYKPNSKFPIWHCDGSGSHDFCGSCILVNRGEHSDGICPCDGKPTGPAYGSHAHHCFVCNKPFESGEIVGRCPNHFPWENLVHKQCQATPQSINFERYK